MSLLSVRNCVADRFSYLPSLGWAVLLGAGLFYCWQLWVSERVGLRTLVFTQSLAALLLVGLGGFDVAAEPGSGTILRHCGDTLLALDQKSSFAHNNLGLALADRGVFAEAIEEFREGGRD